ncbi:MAG: phosphoesterase [Acidobacteria bacterium]|nr:MAG: phosphoesterase [Acidobacteriota bacterium]
MKEVRVLYHDNCFDGVSSAAVFSRFYKGHVDPGAVIEYEGLTHKAGPQISGELFGEGENVIVDFKYCASERLTWWFDHHESAFLSAEDEAHFRHDTSGKKFHDPSYKSCTKFIAAVVQNNFNHPLPDLRELIYWADIIDGAQFPDAKTAVELKEPAMRLMLVIEASHSSELIHKIIRELQNKPLGKVVEDPEIRSSFEKLYARHFESIEIMRGAARCRNGVIEFDVSDYDLDGYNKFIPYYLFPESVYSVGVSRSAVRAKVSVGTNPWTKRERRYNLAKLCEQYGGGGHSVVAAISFKSAELDRARAAAGEIAQKLRNDLKEGHG